MGAGKLKLFVNFTDPPFGNFLWIYGSKVSKFSSAGFSCVRFLDAFFNLAAVAFALQKIRCCSCTRCPRPGSDSKSKNIPLHTSHFLTFYPQPETMTPVFAA
jgi:hypothetical protein